MVELKKLKRYVEIKKKHDDNSVKCLAYGIGSNQNYFSVNGVDTEEANFDCCEGIVTIILRRHSKKKLKKIDIKSSKSWIPPKKGKYDEPIDYKEFFDKLEIDGEANITIPVLRVPLSYNLRGSQYKEGYNRNWSCAEKKLFGSKYKIKEVYVTMRPCYYCLPSISTKTIYINGDYNGKIYELSPYITEQHNVDFYFSKHDAIAYKEIIMHQEEK